MLGRRLLAVTGVVAALGLVALSVRTTAARWQDTASLDGGRVRSGELSLLNGSATSQTSAYAFDELTASGLRPGSWSQAPLTLANGGSADLDYRLSGVAASGPGALTGALVLTVRPVATAADCPTGIGAAPPAGTPWYAGPLTAASTPTSRSLSAAARDALCIRVDLTATAPAGAQNASTALTFTFAAVST